MKLLNDRFNYLNKKISILLTNNENILKFLNFIFLQFHVNLFIMILQEFLINLFNIHLSNIICILKKNLVLL